MKRVITIYVVYLLAVYLLLNDTGPILPRLWYFAMRDCQRAAAMFGRWGISAEMHYAKAINRASLAS